MREEIAPIIQVIFERSIQTGKLPSDWCRAQVSPIFKKGDKGDTGCKLQTDLSYMHSLQDP